MLRFAIDVTWVRHKIVGGTESFVNNLISGFLDIDEEYSMVIIAAEDNVELFRQYESDSRIELCTTSAISASVIKRVLWQNFKMSKYLLDKELTLCLEPVYCKPILSSKQIRFLTVIHDLEALHFPKNHSFITNLWLRIGWRSAAKTSDHVVSISDFVRNDIISRYHINESKITTIYDPITVDVSEQRDFSEVSGMYDVQDGEYYYTVSKLNPHKNLTTLVKTFGEIKKKGITDLPCKLLISGVNGGMEEQLWEIAKEYELKDELVLTGFVENDVRNCLYSHAKAFLFPSVFEGFGMPPIEAICCGTPVVTTKMACIPEITQNLANYVEDPYDPDDWISVMRNITNRNQLFDVDIYKPGNIAMQYLKILHRYKN